MRGALRTADTLQKVPPPHTPRTRQHPRPAPTPLNDRRAGAPARAIAESGGPAAPCPVKPARARKGRSGRAGKEHGRPRLPTPVSDLCPCPALSTAWP